MADPTIRDAVMMAWRDMGAAAQMGIGRALGYVISPRYAEGLWLDFWGKLLRRARVAGETEGAYRDRLLSAYAVVSPNAIRAAIEAVFADSPQPHAALEPAIEGSFVEAGDGSTSTWDDFLQGSTQRYLGINMGSDVADIGSMYVVPSASGALFWIVASDNTGDDLDTPHTVSLTEEPAAEDYVSTSSTAWSYLRTAATDLFDRLRSEIDARKAGGIIWLGFVDPYLSGAV